MRVAIAGMNEIQTSIMLELLTPIFRNVEVFGQEKIETGELATTGAHALIIDYSAESIMGYESVLQMIDKNEPRCVLSEQSLARMSHEERLVWRKKTIGEIVRLLPDYADEIKDLERNCAETDVWVVGSSSGGPAALTKLFSDLPPLPICIIVSQHMDSDSGLAHLRQVLSSRQQGWAVKLASDGAEVTPGVAYIVQRGTAIGIEGNRLKVFQEDAKNVPKPNINECIRALRRTTTKKIGYVILTGMGDDGTAAIKESKHRAIKVFAQEASECPCSSMPDALRKSGAVDASDTISGIASRMAEHYQLTAG